MNVLSAIMVHLIEITIVTGAEELIMLFGEENFQRRFSVNVWHFWRYTNGSLFLLVAVLIK
jgi:hypothetical protein